MDKIAAATDNYIGALSNVTVSGQVGQTSVYVRVAWPWITLPAAVIALGAIFLVITILETKRLGARVWTTSKLAILFHPTPNINREDDQSIATISDMQRKASELCMKMELGKIEEKRTGR